MNEYMSTSLTVEPMLVTSFDTGRAHHCSLQPACWPLKIDDHPCRFVQVQQQKGARDCGLFITAFALHDAQEDDVPKLQ